VRGRADRALTPWQQVPLRLRASHHSYFGASADAWCDAAPALARRLAAAWRLTPDGPTTHGGVAWVLPVRTADGTRAVLKVQPVDDETRGEPLALAAWDGDGAVRLLAHDVDSGTMLLERLGASLEAEPDDVAGCTVIGGLLAHLRTHTPPAGLPRLTTVLGNLLERAPAAIPRLPDDAGRDALARCAAVGHELAAEPPGDRLLHWDLHYANVLAAPDPARGDWLAIDPKPLVGHQGFELLPALRNRWDDVVRAGTHDHLRRRFDVLCDTAGLDTRHAAAWTCVRVLQNLVWEAEQDVPRWTASAERVVADVVLPLAR
jgi:streptomycin 6-kinase